MSLLGPTLIGLPSDTSTVLAQPLADAITSAVKTIGIRKRINRHSSTLNPTSDEIDERKRDSSHDAVEHVNASPMNG
jgi:hypothetical protein